MCLCTNTALQANITECVLAGCTIYEGLGEHSTSFESSVFVPVLTARITETKNVTYTMCGVEVRDDSTTPLLVGVIGGAIALLVFILRMCSALPSSGRLLGWDDWTMAITVALAVPPTVFSVLLSQNGLGKDMWTLPLKNIENVLFVRISRRPCTLLLLTHQVLLSRRDLLLCFPFLQQDFALAVHFTSLPRRKVPACSLCNHRPMRRIRFRLCARNCLPVSPYQSLLASGG